MYSEIHALSSSPAAMLLHDLQNAGVTDIVGEAPFSWGSDPEIAVKKPVVVASAPEKEAEILEQEEAPIVQKQNAADTVWSVGQATHLLVILTGNQSGEHGLSAQAEALWHKMLGRLGISIDGVGYLVVNESAEQGDTLTMHLNQQVKEAGADNVLCFGQSVAGMLTGQEETSLSQMRGQIHKVSKKNTLVTYHPKTLLNQPVLKRLAWQDLLLLINKEKSA